MALADIHFYRPPTKLGKVMFIEVFVCPWGGGYVQGGSPQTWDTVGKRAVRILLECSLVTKILV